MRHFVNIRQSYPTEAKTISLLDSLILLSQRDKAFFTSLRNFKSYSPNGRNSICFMMCGWKRTYEKVWESFKHLLTFQPILTILTDLSGIRINCSNSKHCHIFWSTPPINQLTLLFSSLTRKDHFITICDIW